jgi:heat shock protein HtpX
MPRPRELFDPRRQITRGRSNNFSSGDAESGVAHFPAMSTLREEGCPQCGQTLVQAGEVPPWCPDCEWNLDAYEEPRNGEYLSRRLRRLLRRDHHRAFAMNGQLFDELRTTRPTQPGWTRDRLILLSSSAALLLMSIACIVVGIVLVLMFRDFLFVPGIILVLIGIELRPRLPRYRAELGQLSRDEAPRTFELIGRVAAAIGAPMPDTVVVDEDYNAACGRAGLRRRPFLVVGLPLWGALSGPGRTALLGHELGHLVNGDPSQALLTQPALTTFGRLAEIFDPRGMVSRGSIRGSRTRAARVRASSDLARVLVYAFWPIKWLCELLHVRMHVLAARDSQRAEYYADAVALDVAGSAGAGEMIEAVLLAAPVRTAVRRVARTSGDPSDWCAARADAVAQLRDGRPRYEQLSIRRGAQLFASHPPDGLRARLIRSWPPENARLSITADEWRASDAELAGHYRRVARALQT